VKDRIFEGFLARQRDEGLALSAASDRLRLAPLDPRGTRYAAAFSCRGLVQRGPGQIVEADRFEIEIWFPPNYLRQVDPFRVLRWIGPVNVFHPNISPIAPLICVGRVEPGTPLVDLLTQVHEIVTWSKVTMREDDALNRVACEWARHHLDRLPIDPRPLRRRTLTLDVRPIATHEGGDVR
jgi:hypothetical protein